MTLLFSSSSGKKSSIATILDTGAGQKRGGLLGTVMAAQRQLRSLPVQPLSVLKQAKSYLGMRDEALKIGLFIDPHVSDDCINALVTHFKPSSPKARIFVHILSDDMALGDHVSYNAIVFAVSNPSSPDSPLSAATMIKQAKSLELPSLVIAEKGLRREAAEAYGISILDVASARSSELMMAQTASWFAEALSEYRMALAADFTFMRPALSYATINATARQNAIIAAVFFMPGADLPAMTFNQIKMVLQLALIHGEELTLRRIAEAAVVVLSAYLSRIVVRFTTKDMTLFLRLPIKIAVAYTSTLALGKGMEAWLHQAPSIPALDKSIPELLENTPLAKLLPTPELESAEVASKVETQASKV